LLQLWNISTLPMLDGIAVMPDVHLGKGATVGSVIATNGLISPAAVGVDIGCGMLAVPLHVKIDSINLQHYYDTISRVIPLGHRGHEISKYNMKARMHLDTASKRVQSVWKKAHSQIGTLGGGNHFIEVCHDENDDAWLMLHSGSRNVGKSIADIHIGKAKQIMKAYHIELADPDLAYLVNNTPEFDEYMEDLQWAQEYASHNRQTMLDLIMRALGLGYKTTEVINCHHNYVALENYNKKNLLITRKGAIRARKDDLGIIPGSMGQKSYIVRGKGNAEAYCSCSHGAGRVYSRTAAKKKFTVDDLVEQTKGVICRKDEGIIDEIPSAYKNIDEVMENQKDLVDIVHTLKAVVCVKG